ncbi:MAG: universal stress protein [Cyclobacteriaceae bacterium]
MNIKNILVPVDFSECSKNALRFAIDLAKKFDAKIHMVNAVHVHTAHPDLVGGGLIQTVVKDYEEQVKASFEKLEQEVIELKDVPHSADRFLAYLIDAIHTEAETKNIDLIVMGTRAEHDKVEHLLGTHTSDVIESANVPVLVVPEQWSGTIEKIGFAFESVEIKNLFRLGMLNNIAARFECKVLGFSVHKPGTKITVAEQKVFKEIVSCFDDSVASVRSIEAESPIEGILSFTKEANIDMLALIPKKKSFFQRIFQTSVSKNIVLEINIPLLSFRE